MNKEETKKAIEVMQAFVDGKKIQVKAKMDWDSMEDLVEEEPLWDWQTFQYRIKPSPRVFYAVQKQGHRFPDPDLYSEPPEIDIHSKIIKLQEVID